MTNTAYVFDVNTGAQLATRQLAAPFDPPPRNPGARWTDGNIYHNWGITATPVIDVATNTIYVTTFGKPNASSQNNERNNLLWILDANTLADKQPPVLIAGNADNGGGGISNGFTTPYQKMRAGLGLLTDAGGNKAVVVSFSINGENPRGPGHGFVVAYDVRGLNREAGFTPTPAIWNVTPGAAPAACGCRAPGPRSTATTSTSLRATAWIPGTMAGNFGESFVKLRYTAGVAGVDNGKPKLVVFDYWGAFSDFGRADEDQDIGAAGVVLIPDRGNLIGGGKDGILYNLNKDNLGKTTWDPQFNLPFVATYLPNAPNGPAGLPTTTVPDPNWPIVNRDRNLPSQTPFGKSYHIHGTPVYMERATGGILYVWGENERLKAYNYDFATKRITSFRGQGTQFASGNMAPPGGMPGGRLVVSSNGTAAGHRHCLGHLPDAGECEFSRRSRRARRLRRDGTHQRHQSEAAFPQRREPRQQYGELCQVLDAGGGERQGLCRDVQQQGRAVRPLRHKGYRYDGMVCPCGNCSSTGRLQYRVLRTDCGARHAECAHRAGATGPRCGCRISDKRLERPGCNDLRLCQGQFECSRTGGSQGPFTGDLSIHLLQYRQRLPSFVI